MTAKLINGTKDWTSFSATGWGCTTGKTKDSAIAMLEVMCEDTAVGEDSSTTDTLTHQAGPSLSFSVPSDVSLSSPVPVEALEGISEDGPSTSGSCAPLSTSTSNDEVSEHSRLRAESAELFLSLLPCSPVQVSGHGTETTYFWNTCTNLMKRRGSPRVQCS
ncbi:uncharacterized protein LOC144014743 [Festucalex cinctus]